MSEESCQPGTQEFAAAAKTMADKQFARLVTELRGNADLLTMIFSCSYDAQEGYCLGLQGDAKDIANTVALVIHHLAGIAYAKAQDKDRYLPAGERRTYRKMIVEVSKHILSVAYLLQGEEWDKPLSLTPDAGNPTRSDQSESLPAGEDRVH